MKIKKSFSLFCLLTLIRISLKSHSLTEQVFSLLELLSLAGFVHWCTFLSFYTLLFCILDTEKNSRIGHRTCIFHILFTLLMWEEILWSRLFKSRTAKFSNLKLITSWQLVYSISVYIKRKVQQEKFKLFNVIFRFLGDFIYKCFSKLSC